MSAEIALAISGMLLDQTQHVDFLSTAEAFHRAELAASIQQHKEKLEQAVAHHKEDATAERRQFTARVSHQRIAAEKESSRDRWQQQNETVQILMIMAVLLFGIAYVLLVDGGRQLPPDLIPMYNLPLLFTNSSNTNTSSPTTTIMVKIGIEGVADIMAGRTRIATGNAEVPYLELGQAQTSYAAGSSWGLLFYAAFCSTALLCALASIVTLLQMYRRMSLYDFNHPLKLYPCCSAPCSLGAATVAPPVKPTPPSSPKSPTQTEGQGDVRQGSNRESGDNNGIIEQSAVDVTLRAEDARNAEDGRCSPCEMTSRTNSSLLGGSSLKGNLSRQTSFAVQLEEHEASSPVENPALYDDDSEDDDDGSQTDVAASTLFFSPPKEPKPCCCAHSRHLTFQDFYDRHCAHMEQAAVILFYGSVEACLGGVLVFQLLKYQYVYVYSENHGVPVGDTANTLLFTTTVLLGMLWPLVGRLLFPPPLPAMFSGE